MIKKIFLVTLLLFSCISPSVAKASFDPKSDYEINDISDHKVYTTKQNVKTYEEWGQGRRVSDNINGPKGTLVKSTIISTFGVESSGEISGLGMSISKKITSEIGFEIHTPSSGSYYMAFKPKYKVEKGTRIRKTSSGAIISKNEYTIKTPIYGEYYLVRDR